MYRQKSKGWYKHKDFIFMDLCCIVIAFILADWFRHEAIINLYTDEIYRNTIIFIGHYKTLWLMHTAHLIKDIFLILPDTVWL